MPESLPKDTDTQEPDTATSLKEYDIEIDSEPDDSDTDHEALLSTRAEQGWKKAGEESTTIMEFDGQNFKPIGYQTQEDIINKYKLDGFEIELVEAPEQNLDTIKGQFSPEELDSIEKSGAEGKKYYVFMRPINNTDNNSTETI